MAMTKISPKWWPILPSTVTDFCWSQDKFPVDPWRNFRHGQGSYSQTWKMSKTELQKVLKYFFVKTKVFKMLSPDCAQKLVLSCWMPLWFAICCLLPSLKESHYFFCSYFMYMNNYFPKLSLSIYFSEIICCTYVKVSSMLCFYIIREMVKLCFLPCRVHWQDVYRVTKYPQPCTQLHYSQGCQTKWKCKNRDRFWFAKQLYWVY